MEQAIGTGMNFLLVLAISAGVGLLIGALARLVLPGPDPMSWLATLGFGMAGAIAGGLIAGLLRVPPLLDVVLQVALAALLIWYFKRRRTGRKPGIEPGRSES
jgi:uncharacterized membrane protein YeaQ/YmgE (transglycosylase-associated protein family)